MKMLFYLVAAIGLIVLIVGAVLKFSAHPHGLTLLAVGIVLLIVGIVGPMVVRPRSI